MTNCTHVCKKGVKTGEPAGLCGPGDKKAKTTFRERPGALSEAGKRRRNRTGKQKGEGVQSARKKRKAGRVVSNPEKTASKRRGRRCQHGAEGSPKMREISAEKTVMSDPIRQPQKEG